MRERRPNKPRRTAAAILILLLLLLIAVVWILISQRQDQGGTQSGSGGQQIDSSHDTMVVRGRDMLPGLPESPRTTSRRARRAAPMDTISRDALAVDTAREADSLRDTAMGLTDSNDLAPSSTDPCVRDTAAPWVYPEPSGGLHRGAVKVRLVSTKPCAIEWRMRETDPWQLYKGQEISISRSSSVLFRAVDSCGNQMDPRQEYYEITSQKSAAHCPQDMEYVEVGGTRFCVDRYEWPNRRGIRPSSFVSLYQANDSCFSRGKRLCTTDEWVVACGGPFGWAYPYGDVYEPHACVTQDTAFKPSGSRPECRGYFGIFDMSGNLAEWTDTRATKNPQFYNVKGGYWASGAGVTCRDTRYSYFPQNRHNPVGFRCCQDSK